MSIPYHGSTIGDPTVSQPAFGAVLDRPPQKLTALLAIGCSASCLLCGYEFIRSVSSSLFLEYYGADKLPIVMAIGPIGTLLFIYCYGLLLSWVGPRRALLITSLVTACIIALCFVALSRHVAVASAVLYVFREAYIVVLVEQYWSFINSTVTPRQSRLFNGPITGFGSIGAIAGATIVSQYAKHLGSETLLLFAVASLIPAALLSEVAYRVGGEPQPSVQEAHGRQGHLAVGLFARHPYLVLLFILVILTQAVSTVLDIRFSGLAHAAYADKNARTAFFGTFYATVNAAAFILQFGVTPLALRFVRIRVIHSVIPLIHMAAAAAVLFRPSVLTGAAALLIFKAFDYSLFKAAKETLYVPLTFDERYRAKVVIDAFGYRFSKGGMGLLLAAAGGVLGKLPTTVYPVIAMAAAGLWLPVVLALTSPKPGATSVLPHRNE